MECSHEKKHSVLSLTIRSATASAAALLLLWGIIPVSVGIMNAGVISTVAVCAAVIALCVFYRQFTALLKCAWSVPAGRIAVVAAGVASFVVLTMFISASVLMLHSAAKEPPENSTVIVPGAGLDGDRPSLMLAHRLESAAKYLRENPDSSCIVTGGQGADEICTEADAMFRYLTQELGISPDRVILEENSTTTMENIRFAMELIKENGLKTDTVIATQEFHQYRAQQMAKRAGASRVGPATCHTPWYLMECYWIREFAAVSRFWLLGA